MTTVATPPAREAVASDSTLVNEDSSATAERQAHEMLGIARSAVLGIRGRRRRTGMQIRIELFRMGLRVPHEDVVAALNRNAQQYGLEPCESTEPGVHHLRIT